jgi:hypothetical protein
MKKIICLCLFLNFAMNMSAQINMTLHAGLSHGYSRDQVLAPKGNGHNGYLIGADIRLLDDGICFLFSGDYGKFNLSPDNKFNFFSNHSLAYYKMKGGFGFDLARLSKNVKLRSKIQGNLTYLNKYDPIDVGPSPLLREYGYTQLNEAIAGLSSCIGVTVGNIDFELEYEYGFYNIYYTKKDSKINFINLYTGYRL